MNTLPYSHTNNTKFSRIDVNFIPSFYMNSVSPALTGWENILWKFDSCVEDEEVWAIARGSEKIPHLGNLYQSLVIGRLESLFFELTGLDESDESVNVFTFVNGYDSHFCINGESINDEISFITKVEEMKITH